MIETTALAMSVLFADFESVLGAFTVALGGLVAVHMAIARGRQLAVVRSREALRAETSSVESAP